MTDLQTNSKLWRTTAHLLTGIFILLGVVLGIRQFLQGETSRGLLGCASVLFLLVYPVGKWLGVAHPYRLYSLLFAFCIMAYDIGCVHQGFDAYPYFDKVSHFLSGMVFTIFGFCVFFYFARPRGNLGDNLWLSCTYALFFSLFVAVVWEVCEFTGFLLTGHDSQHHLDTGVFDTMEDLISCLVGSLISVGAFVWYAKKRIKLVTAAVVEEFFELNRKRD